MAEIDGALEFAKKLAHQAGALMKENFSLGMKKEWKEDTTPLTETDLAINQMVLEAVAKTYPEHSFIGEEGSNEKESEYAWVCDPVDGTIPFSNGYPTFAFSLALTKNGESMLGVAYDPIMDRMVWAEKGAGAFLNGKKISVSREKTFSIESVVEIGETRVSGLRALLRERGARIPLFYSCVYAGMLVAMGEFTASSYPWDKPWDGAAIKVIVEEAGGKVTDFDGNEQRYDRKINGFIASNGFVHDEIIQALALRK